MDQINPNDNSRQQPGKKEPNLAEIRAEMDPLYRENGFTAPKGPDAKSYLNEDGQRITDDFDNLDLDVEGEIPLPNEDPAPVAKPAEFGALLHTKSDIELELLRHFDPETITIVDEKGNVLRDGTGKTYKDEQGYYRKDGTGKEYRGLDMVMTKFAPEDGSGYVPTRELLLKDASGVVWAARTGSSDLRLSKQPITSEYPLENAEFETKELDATERYVLERWGRNGLSRAVDMESGKEYKGFEAITAAMKEDNRRLRLYEPTNGGKESRMFHVFRNDTKRMDDGYITEQKFSISDGAVRSDEEAGELIPLEQEKLTRNLKDVIQGGKAAGSDFEAFALDEKGNMYHAPEDMAKQLLSEKNANKLFLFTKKGQAPYCLMHDYGYLSMSQDIITPDNQLEQDKNKLYTPAKSLNPTEMAVSGKKLDYLFEKRKKLDEHYRVYIPKMRDDAEGTLKEEASYFSRNKRPRLGFFGTIGNWFSKTFQKRPSKAYEAYTERKKEYEKHVAKRATMNRRLKALDAAEKREAKQLKELSEEIEPLRKDYQARMSGGPWEKAREVNAYRQRTEVRMAGVADLTEKEKITEENIFAYTWLRGAACRGKSLGDMEAESHLYRYIAASMVEEAILIDAMKNPGITPQAQVLLNHLNDGTAVEALSRDKDLKAVLAEYEGPIDPEEISSRYKERVKERNAEALKPENRLKEARRDLLDRYGEKPITEDALVDIMRLNNLDNYIGASQRTQRKKGEDPYFSDLQNNKDNKTLGHIIGDMVKEPGKTKVIHHEEFMGPEYRKALKGVMLDSEKNLQEARQKVREQYKDLPASMQEKLMPKGNMGLEELTRRVNEAVKNKTYENLKLGPESKKESQELEPGGPTL
ncbi:MAG: hypothetical protein IKP17_03810 [Oscillospiraceae bacterium]|nr:hypothetical protein [Oscillospiraceae bacterium]